MPRLQATGASATISRALAFAFGLVGFVGGNFFLLLIAFFIYVAVAVAGETESVMFVESLAGIPARDLMTRDVQTVAPSMRVGDLRQKMLHERFLAFPVIHEPGRVVGMAILKDARGADPGATVADIMSREVPFLPEGASAVDSFEPMGRKGAGRVVVVGRDGAMVALVSRTDLVRAVQVRMVEMELAPEPA